MITKKILSSLQISSPSYALLSDNPLTERVSNCGSGRPRVWSTSLLAGSEDGRAMGMTRMAWTLAGWGRPLRSILALALVGVAVAAVAENGNRPIEGAGSDAIGSDTILTQKKAFLNTYLRAPLQFEVNQGQADRQVQFLSRGPGYSLFLTSSKAVLSLKSPAGKEATLEMVVAGSDRSITVSGIEPSAARSNYFRGNDPAQWRTNVPEYGKVQYRQLYPGIDLTFYGNQRRLEYDFVVAPGADPHKIRLQFQGMNRMRLDREGGLHLQTAGGEVRLDRPALYQENADGSRVTVQGSFAMERHEVLFTVGDYDKSRPLVIDPVLSYSTFLGGSNNQNDLNDGKSGSYLSGIAVGADGSVYVTGLTSSTDFPTSVGTSQTALGGGVDVFVTKFNPSGTALSYSTYLGGSSNDFSDGIAIDSSGNAYITGSTSSSNFPTTTGTIQTSAPTSNCGFVTKLNPAGNALVYSTYLGGSVVTELTAIAVDSNGNAYVTGLDNKGFPTTAGAFQTTVPGQENAVVAKLAVDGKTLVYSTYIGGEKADIPRGIAVDALGNAYIAGYTNSVHFPILPAVGALQPAIGNTDGTNDAFVSKINSTGTALLYSTYLGGSGRDEAYAIAVDSAGSAYVTGLTASTNFPTASPLQSALGGTTAGDVDAFVAKLSSSGTSLVYSTYLGGGNPDFGEGIAVDSLGDAYVAGVTGSSAGHIRSLYSIRFQRRTLSRPWDSSQSTTRRDLPLFTPRSSAEAKLSKPRRSLWTRMALPTSRAGTHSQPICLSPPASSRLRSRDRRMRLSRSCGPSRLRRPRWPFPIPLSTLRAPRSSPH